MFLSEQRLGTLGTSNCLYGPSWKPQPVHWKVALPFPHHPVGWQTHDRVAILHGPVQLIMGWRRSQQYQMICKCFFCTIN
ncbi:uncharacterized protein YALI1_E37687g [Yarrowia lipolytica]|uniref:Uncharacterized protein n=1 Tax=Yarrowia lipolytica TaxID=4952 RepID=A0A1D8NKU0_YARLL|nr:hypothetical protein YALI1_E37687g [Yarrowia lipolytica]